MRRRVGGGRWAEPFESAQRRYQHEFGTGGPTPPEVLEFHLAETLGVPLRDLADWDEEQRYRWLGCMEGKALAEWAGQSLPERGS